MPRSVEFTAKGRQWEMPVNYRVSKQIAEKVGDPLRMTLDSASGKVQWTQDDVINILHIGVGAAGCSVARDELAEEIIERGLLECIRVATEYVMMMVTAGPAKPLTGGDDSKKKPSRGSK